MDKKSGTTNFELRLNQDCNFNSTQRFQGTTNMHKILSIFCSSAGHNSLCGFRLDAQNIFVPWAKVDWVKINVIKFDSRKVVLFCQEKNAVFKKQAEKTVSYN